MDNMGKFGENHVLFLVGLIIILSLFVTAIKITYPIDDINITISYNTTVEKDAIGHLNLTNLNVVLYLPFDSKNTSSAILNITIYDYSNFNNNGYIINTTYFNTSCFAGDCIKLKQDDNAIFIPDSNSLDLKNFTLSIWFNMSGFSTSNPAVEESIVPLITKGSDLSFGGVINYYMGLAPLIGSNTKIIFAYEQSNGTGYSTNGTVNLIKGQIYHAIVTQNETTTCIYINGTLDVCSFKNRSPRTDSTNKVYIGSNANNVGGAINATLNGSVDEVMILNRDINSSEVFDIYNSSFNRFEKAGSQYLQFININQDFWITAINLSVYNNQHKGTDIEYRRSLWLLPYGYNDSYDGQPLAGNILNLHFDLNTGDGENESKAIDYSSRNQTITVSNIFLDYEGGIFDGYYVFSIDDNSYMKINDSKSVTNDLSTYTITFWAKIINNGSMANFTNQTFDPIITKGGDSDVNLNFWGIGYNQSTQSIIWAMTNQSGNNISLVGTKVLDNNTWYFITVRHNETYSELLIDNIIDKSSTHTSYLHPTNVTVPIYVGQLAKNSTDNIGQFEGAIDELYLFNRTISDVELTDIYSGGRLLYESGNNITFNEGDATTVNEFTDINISIIRYELIYKASKYNFYSPNTEGNFSYNLSNAVLGGGGACPVSGTDLETCGILDCSDRTFYLQNNISATGNCISIRGHNLTIDGNNSFILSTGIGVVFDAPSENTTLKNIKILTTGGSGYGIYFNSATATQVINLTVDNASIRTTGVSAHGIYFPSMTGNRYVRNTIIKNSNISTASSGYPLYIISPQATNLNITYNTLKTITTTRSPISIAQGLLSTNLSIIGNNLTSPAYIGIYSATMKGALIKDNIIRSLHRSLYFITNNTENKIQNNNFTSTGAYDAIYFTSGSSENYNNVFENNFIESLNIGAASGITFGSRGSNNTFINTKIITHSVINGTEASINQEGGASYLVTATFINITANRTSGTPAIRFNTTTSGSYFNLTNVTGKVIQDMAGTNNFIYRNWYLDVNVSNSSGQAIQNANVTVWDVDNKTKFSFLTNAQGRTSQMILIEYNRSGLASTYYSNYTINMTSSQGNVSVSVNMTDNKFINMQIAGAASDSPTVALNGPANGANSTALTINFNFTANDDSGLVNATLYFNSSTNGAPVSLVQQANRSHVYLSPDINAGAKLSSSPTANNLLIIAIASDKNAGTYTVPNGFTLITTTSATSISGAMAYKISNGTEQTANWTYTTSEESSVWYAEYSGLETSNVLDISAHNTTFSGADTATTIITADNTTSTVQADELAIALAAFDTASNCDTGRSWSNGFSEVDFAWDITAGSGTPGVSISSKTLTSAGAQSTVYSCSDTGDQMYAIIATFKASPVTWHANKTITISGTTNTTNITQILLDNRTYAWNIQVCDTASQCSFNNTNYTLFVNTSLVSDSSPYFIINSPTNNSDVTTPTAFLNWTVQDNNNSNEIFVWASNDSVDINDHLVYHKLSQANGTYTYNWSGLSISSNLSDLVGLWHFDNLSSLGENMTRFVDSAKNGLKQDNATAYGTPTFTEEGRFAGAIGLSSGNSVWIANSLELSASPEYTIMGWFNMTSNGTSVSSGTGGVLVYPLVNKGIGEAESATQDIYFFVGVNSSNNKLCNDYEDSATSGNHPVCGSTTIVENTSYFFTIVKNTSSNVIYLNGMQDGKIDSATNPTTSSIHRVGIGIAHNSLNTTSGVFNGFVDEIAFFNRSMTIAEVRNYYNLTLGKKFWRVNATDGTNMNSSGEFVFNLTVVVGADVTNPSVTLNLPIDVANLTSTDVTFNCSATDNVGLSNITLYFNSSGGGQSETNGSITVSVSTGNDDAEECIPDGNTMDLTSSDLEITDEDTAGTCDLGDNNQVIGVRFNNVQIPQGAIIWNASVRFNIDVQQTENTNWTIFAEAIDNAPTFGAGNNNITNRIRTGNFTQFNNVPAPLADGKIFTPNISTVIQEVINRSGWVSGNSIVIIINGTGVREIDSYNGNSTGGEPRLLINYTTTSSSGIAWHANQTNSVSGTSNNTVFSLNLTNSSYNWNCLATDTSNNKAFASSNFTFNISGGAGACSESGLNYFLPPYVMAWNETTQKIRLETKVPVNLTLNYGTTTSYGTNITNTSFATKFEVDIKDLTPNTQYFYKVNIYNTTTSCLQNTSVSNNFTTSQDAKTSFTFAVLGDSRESACGSLGSNFPTILANIEARNPDFVIMVGDDIQAEGCTTAPNPDDFAWQGFLNRTIVIQEGKSMLSAIGNHEDPDRAAARAAWRNFWMQPENGNGRVDEWNETSLTWRYGNSLFIIWNSEETVNTGNLTGAQFTWFNNTALNQTGYTHKFVFSHKAIAGTLRSDTLSALDRSWSKYITSEMYRNGVTAAFAGHDHFYCFNVTDTSLINVITGGAGSPLNAITNCQGNFNGINGTSQFNYVLVNVTGSTINATVYNGVNDSVIHNFARTMGTTKDISSIFSVGSFINNLKDLIKGESAILSNILSLNNLMDFLKAKADILNIISSSNFLFNKLFSTSNIFTILSSSNNILERLFSTSNILTIITSFDNINDLIKSYTNLLSLSISSDSLIEKILSPSNILSILFSTDNIIETLISQSNTLSIIISTNFLLERLFSTSNILNVITSFDNINDLIKSQTNILIVIIPSNNFIERIITQSNILSLILSHKNLYEFLIGQSTILNLIISSLSTSGITSLINLSNILSILSFQTIVIEKLLSSSSILNIVFSLDTISDLIKSQTSILSLIISQTSIIEKIFTSSNILSILFSTDNIIETLISQSSIINIIFSLDNIQDLIKSQANILSILLSTDNLLDKLLSSSNTLSILTSTNTLLERLLSSSNILTILFSSDNIIEIIISQPSVLNLILSSLITSGTTTLVNLSNILTNLISSNILLDKILSSSSILNIIFSFDNIQDILKSQANLLSLNILSSDLINKMFTSSNILSILFSTDNIIETLKSSSSQLQLINIFNQNFDIIKPFSNVLSLVFSFDNIQDILKSQVNLISLSSFFDTSFNFIQSQTAILTSLININRLIDIFISKTSIFNLISSFQFTTGTTTLISFSNILSLSTIQDRIIDVSVSLLTLLRNLISFFFPSAAGISGISGGVSTIITNAAENITTTTIPIPLEKGTFINSLMKNKITFILLISTIAATLILIIAFINSYINKQIKINRKEEI